MSSTDDGVSLGAEQRQTLLRVAAGSIRAGLTDGRPLAPSTLACPADLRAERASFVTLTIGGQLRGCIGVLQAIRSLVVDVAVNAFAAAFEDPRFPPLAAAEYPHLEIHISVLSAPEALSFSSEADLLHQLRPMTDGLVLEDDGYRGTFLPSVWASLPEPREFLRHLKHKAGLPGDYWSNSLRVSRYTTESFGASMTELDAETLAGA
jgi:AmmeMemoRadiSam system protein A